MLFKIGNYKKEIPMMGIVQRQSNIYEFYHVQAINKNCTKENTKLGIIAKRSKNCTKEKQKLYQGEAKIVPG